MAAILLDTFVNRFYLVWLEERLTHSGIASDAPHLQQQPQLAPSCSHDGAQARLHLKSKLAFGELNSPAVGSLSRLEFEYWQLPSSIVAASLSSIPATSSWPKLISASCFVYLFNNQLFEADWNLYHPSFKRQLPLTNFTLATVNN